MNQRVRAAQEAIEDAQLNYDYCFVRAPFDGYVTNLNISEGQYANPGVPVLTLVDDREWYVLAYFREDLLDRIRPGMPAEISITELPWQTFPGRGARYWMGTVPGKWRDCRRLARCRGDAELGAPQPAVSCSDCSQRDNSDPPFRMGQTAVVTIRGGR